jgi:hypothetical protein
VLKISVVESRCERRLILEGKLFAPWLTELRTAYIRPLQPLRDAPQRSYRMHRGGLSADCILVHCGRRPWIR